VGKNYSLIIIATNATITKQHDQQDNQKQSKEERERERKKDKLGLMDEWMKILNNLQSIQNPITLILLSLNLALKSV